MLLIAEVFSPDHGLTETSNFVQRNQFIVVLMEYYVIINSLNAELNPTCHFLALLVAHHILHVSSIRVNSYINTRECLMFSIPKCYNI